MTLRIFTLSLSLILITGACKTKKKNASTNSNTEELTIQLDTIKVNSNDASKKEVYRESNPRLTDIIHTRLDVSFDWQKSRLNGKAVIFAKAHFYPTNKLFLDARGMEIKSIDMLNENPESLSKNASKSLSVNISPQKTPLKYVYEHDSIKIDLGRVYKSSENYSIQIEYIAKPDELSEGGSAAINSDKGLYFINPKGDNLFKMPQIWTQGETQSNSAWFPTVDNPIEKMTDEIYMTVEDKYTTLSNGLLIESKKNADGTRTDYWKMDLPHSPYLVMMAVGQFKKVVDEPWRGKEISYYVEKEYEPHAKGIFGDTKEMIEFYSTRLGVPYAWQKYAQIAVRDYVSGAMENTSATLHGDFTVYQTTREMIDGKKGSDIIAHELFHQWFGDLVTSESWSNLPLNESFATYGEYLWEEYKNGRDAADNHHSQSRSGYLFSEKEVNLIRYYYDDREDMFDAFSYAKGGQILHMLRKAVGDDAFFASLKNYLETNKFKTAEIHNLRLAFEETTGTDMNWFFNQWFLNKGRPVINVSKNYNNANSEIELTIEQNQNLSEVPLYKLPIEIDLYVNNVAQRTKIWVTEKKQTFKIKTQGVPQLVNFDAERQLLCDLTYAKTQDEYLFQYKFAPLYDDRMEALKNLEKNLNEAAVYEIFRWAAVNDKYAPIRNYCILRLSGSPEEKMAEVKKLFTDIYNSDKKTTTRAKALFSLNNKFAKDADVIALNEKAFQESSYAIIGEALNAVSKSNVKLAMEKAKVLENEPGKDLIFPIAELYANNGADEQIAFFTNMIKYVNGFELLTFCSDYTKTAKRCVTPEAVIAAATDLEAIAKTGSRFTKYGGIKGIKDLQNIWEGKEKTIMAKIESDKKENKDVSSLQKELILITKTKDTLAQMYKGVK